MKYILVALALGAVLVIFMQDGFAALESGMSPLNNAVNVMSRISRICVIE